MKFADPPEISAWLGMQHVAHLEPRNDWHERFEVGSQELLFMAVWAYVKFEGTLFDLASTRLVLSVGHKPYYEVSLASVVVPESNDDRLRVLEDRIRVLENAMTAPPKEAVGPGPYRTLSPVLVENTRLGNHRLELPVYAEKTHLVDVNLRGAPRELEACTIVFGCLDRRLVP